MAKENETTADLIAWLRRPREGENGYLTAWRDEIADRLEAAHKRELDALSEQIADLRQQRDLWSKRSAELVEKCNEHYAKLKQVGNAAKLREALIKLRSAIYRDEDGDAHIAPDIIVENIIDTALAAPARNCDVHTADELKAIFKSELVSELPIANEHEKNLVTITANGVIDTLYAPATEQEGCAK